MSKNKLVLVVAFSAFVPCIAVGNPFHEKFAKMPESNRNEAFTDYMSKTSDPCKVDKSFFQGFTEKQSAVWSVSCTNKKNYAIMIDNDARGSTRFVECEKMKAATKGQRECFKKY